MSRDLLNEFIQSIRDSPFEDAADDDLLSAYLLFSGPLELVSPIGPFMLVSNHLSPGDLNALA